MNLTPEQQELGRRNFLRVLAGTPALAALGAAAAVEGPRARRSRAPRLHRHGRPGPRAARADRPALRARSWPSATSTRSSSRRPTSRSSRPARQPAKHYADWKEMIQKEKLEGVVIASPLFTHADIAVGCMEAGLHVLCEKMMGWDDASCRRMADAAQAHRPRARDRPPALLQPGLPGRPTTASSRPACSATSTTRGSSGTATAAGAARPSCPRPTTTPRSGATRPTTT